MDFANELEGIMLAFTQALPKFNQQFGRVNWVSLELSNVG
jgi:hypothetical protein